MATITVPRGTSDLSGLGTADHDILQFMNGECVVTAGSTFRASPTGSPR